MEKRNAQRLSGVSEITLSDETGAKIARASIGDLSEGGILVTYVEPHELAQLQVGQPLRFQFVVPTGEVAGTAEILRKSGSGESPHENSVGLRFRTIDNEDGLAHLMGFLHSWFCGVD